jgi:hypothetical protein
MSAYLIFTGERTLDAAEVAAYAEAAPATTA